MTTKTVFKNATVALTVTLAALGSALAPVPAMAHGHHHGGHHHGYHHHGGHHHRHHHHVGRDIAIGVASAAIVGSIINDNEPRYYNNYDNGGCYYARDNYGYRVQVCD